MVAIGLSVISGYDKDIDASRRAADENADGQIWCNRYFWGTRLFMTTILARNIKEANNMQLANICGIVAGLISVYAFGLKNLEWRRRGGLGWKDVTCQGALLGLLGVASYVSSNKET